MQGFPVLPARPSEASEAAGKFTTSLREKQKREPLKALALACLCNQTNGYLGGAGAEPGTGFALLYSLMKSSVTSRRGSYHNKIPAFKELARSTSTVMPFCAVYCWANFSSFSEIGCSARSRALPPSA